MNINTGITVAAIAGMIAVPALAQSQPQNVHTINFDAMDHGQVVNQPVDGVSIAAGAEDGYQAVVFDTRLRGTADEQLQGPNGESGAWTSGNLPHNTVLGNILTLRPKADTTEVIAPPSIVFEFASPIAELGFDAIGGEPGDTLVFYSEDEKVGELSFDDIMNPSNDAYDATVKFGVGSANRISPLSAALFGVEGFDRVELFAAKGTGITNINYTDAESITSFGFDLNLAANNFDGGFGGSGTDQGTSGGVAANELFVVGGPSFGGSGDAESNTVIVPDDDPDNPDDPNPPHPPKVPSPGAAAAGLALLGGLILRRRRNG